MAYARLQRKHLKLKKALKEYKLLTKVIQEENTKHRDQALKTRPSLKSSRGETRKPQMWLYLG